MINFNCLKCGTVHAVKEFRSTDTPNIIKVPCICSCIMQVTKPCDDLEAYEIGTFCPPPIAAVYDYDC